MKFFSSTSSSSCSTNNSTCSSNNANNCNIYVMFRRLLCSNNIPTHPTIVCEKHDDQEKTTPGVVARLMGLESMPTTSSTCYKSSISRSRSMNYVDSLKQLEHSSIKGNNDHHRHSFREPPTMSYLELIEDEKFFILSFEKSGKIRSKQGKRTEVEITKHTRKDHKLKNNKKSTSTSTSTSHEMTRDKTSSDHHVNNKVSTQKLKDSSNNNILRPINDNCLSVGMQDSQGKTISIKNKTTKKDESVRVDKPVTESDSGKSSPNSVLDFVETQNSEKYFSRMTSSRSRRTLYEELENYRKMKLIIDDNNVDETKRSDHQRDNCVDKSWNKECYKDENYVHIWRGICRLVYRETMEKKNEIYKFGDCKEIGGDLGLEILDQLLEELVDQLVGE